MFLADTLEASQQSMRAHKQAVALDLKRHVDGVQSSMKERAELHQIRAQQRERGHANEFDELLSKALNPYEVRQNVCQSKNFSAQNVSSQC